MFTKQDIIERLETAIHSDELFYIQYWPVFELSSEDLIGCCGIRPFHSDEHSYEIGFHLRKKCWGMGYASEVANVIIDYSFNNLKADKLYAGHPQNEASKKLLSKLGFRYIGDNYYKPTGLNHPSYELVNDRM